MARIAAVVLAAGEGSRFGGAKQLLMLPEVLAALDRAEPVTEVVVVEGRHPLGAAAGSARVVAASDWEKGPGASLRAGLAALGGDIDAAFVILADGPDLAPEAVDAVRHSWQDDGGMVVAASYAGVRGHPLLVAREGWATIPDEGLRSLPVRLVPCDAYGAPGDVDRPDELPERLRSATRRRVRHNRSN